MARAIKRTERVKGSNVNLHPSTWEALRVRAFEERTTISEQVRRAVADYLGAKQTLRARRKKGAA
jgi:hypothetical protein